MRSDGGRLRCGLRLCVRIVTICQKHCRYDSSVVFGMVLSSCDGGENRSVLRQSVADANRAHCFVGGRRRPLFVGAYKSTHRFLWTTRDT